MICRLCLKTINGQTSITIFAEFSGDGESELAKMIAKYFHLEVTQQDAVSNAICQECNNHLTAFHKYCEFVEKQQASLDNKFLLVEFDEQLITPNQVSATELQESMDVQLKCEPEEEFIADTLAMRNDKDNTSVSSHSSEPSRNMEKAANCFIHSNASLKKFDYKVHEVHSLNASYKKLEQDNQILKANFKEIQSCLAEQTRTMAKHTLYLEKLVVDACPETVRINFFPIKSKEEFAEIENNLDFYSAGALTHYIRGVVGSAPIEKSLHLFFSEQFLLEVNWEGHRNKLGMKSSRLFSEYVYGAVKQEGQFYSNFEDAMKKGFRIYKNKIYKKLCIARKPRK